jgi:DnaK suppressor protein
MASAKRAASKGKSTASKKGRTRRKAATKKAVRKAAPARKATAKKRKPAARTAAKPAAKRAPKAGPATRTRKTQGTSKAVPGKAAARPQKAKAKVKATKAPAPAVREMVVRTTPGLVKTTGRRKTSSTARKAARRALEPYDPNALIHGIRPYLPQAGEAYMSTGQLKHFREILLAWKRELMEEVDRTVHHMQDEASNFPDPNDRATQESEFGLELRTRDRERKLLKKIAAALERIDDGSYGYCEETGEEIGLKRLEARPVATLSLEAQERREMSERQYGERDDRYR